MAAPQWAGTCPSGEKASAERETSPSVNGLSETGFPHRSQDQEHVESKLVSCGRPCQELICESRRNGKGSGSRAARGIVARGANVIAGYWNDQKTRLSHFETECFARETSLIRFGRYF